MDHLLETELRNRRNLWTRLTELFTEGRNYRAFRASLVCLFMQQFCGVNVHVDYGPTTFKSTNVSNTKALVANLPFGIINFVFAFPAFYMIDHRRFGRRNLLLFTFPFMALFQLFTAVASVSPERGRRILTYVGMCMYRATSWAWLIDWLTTDDVNFRSLQCSVQPWRRACTVRICSGVDAAVH